MPADADQVLRSWPGRAVGSHPKKYHCSAILIDEYLDAYEDDDILTCACSPALPDARKPAPDVFASASDG